MAKAQRLPEKFVSVDVECVAVGRRHDAKAVASVAVVDQHERVLLKKIVNPDRPVVSYLTPVTGLRHGDLDGGVPLERAVREVKALLGPDVVLVGQGVKGDILWMHLKEGVDFAYAVDLGTMFRVFNSRYQKYFYYTLQHEADTLLEKGRIREEHDPVTDALTSIQLFKKYYGNPQMLDQARAKLRRSRPPPSWSKRNNFVWEGVCMAAYRPDMCRCGAPTMNTTD